MRIFALFFPNYIALCANLLVGTISGDDANAQDPILLRRSMRFGADILEAGLWDEWYFLGKNRFSIGKENTWILSPNGYLGIGGAFTGANASYYGTPEDRDVFLKVSFPEGPLRHQFLIAPMGGGLQADIHEKFSFGLELGWRPVFSDNLDGISLNGNPEVDDW